MSSDNRMLIEMLFTKLPMQSSRKRGKRIAIKQRENSRLSAGGGWQGALEGKKRKEKRNDDDEPADTEAVAI